MARRALRELRRKRQQVQLLDGLKRIAVPLFIVVLIGGAGMLMLQAVLNSRLFWIRQIVSNVAFDEIGSLRKEWYGMSLFRVPLDYYAQRIQSEHAEFKGVSLLKVFPHTLKITIQERKPVAQILIGRKYYCIDQEAIVVSDGSAQPYAGFVEFSGKAMSLIGIKKGARVDREEIRAGLSLLKELFRKRLPQRYQPFRSISIHSLPAVSFEIAGILVQVGEPPYTDKIALLADTLLPEFKDSLKDLKQIDLRFSPPVIGYKR